MVGRSIVRTAPKPSTARERQGGSIHNRTERHKKMYRGTHSSIWTRRNTEMQTDVQRFAQRLEKHRLSDWEGDGEMIGKVD